jgi:hypothetical protein
MTPTTPTAAPGVSVEASEILRIYQTTLGPDRDSCGRNGERQMWDRIDACRAALESFATSRPVAVGVSMERAALRKIADMHPVAYASSSHWPRTRCKHCQYAWAAQEVESHAVDCAYVIAHQALTASTTKAGGAS